MSKIDGRSRARIERGERMAAMLQQDLTELNLGLTVLYEIEWDRYSIVDNVGDEVGNFNNGGQANCFIAGLAYMKERSA